MTDGKYPGVVYEVHVWPEMKERTRIKIGEKLFPVGFGKNVDLCDVMHIEDVETRFLLLHVNSVQSVGADIWRALERGWPNHHWTITTKMQVSEIGELDSPGSPREGTEQTSPRTERDKTGVVGG